MISENMTIAEVLRKNENSAQVFKDFGLYCLGCAIASQETILEAAKTHNVDVERLLAALNKE